MFDAFQRQLAHSVELESMKRSIRSLMGRRVVQKALAREQQSELRWLIMRLVSETETVIRARERSERDVKGFLTTGLASEHHRVGRLLNDLLPRRRSIDWSSRAVRRAPSPLPRWRCQYAPFQY